MSVQVVLENIKTNGEVDFMREWAEEQAVNQYENELVDPEVSLFHDMRGIDMRVVAECQDCDLDGREIIYDMAISLLFDDPAVAAEFAAQFGSDLTVDEEGKA
jgi:hypothetical protein